MEKECKSSKVPDAEANLRVVRLMQRVEEVTGSLIVEANKDIVAFVGPTKSGKSTFINCLLGTQLMCIRDEFDDIFITKAPDAPGPKIGVSGESETEVPVGYENVPGTIFGMWDFPGFGDNKGTEQEIVNAISYQAVLLSQIFVRFVLVVPYSLIRAADALPFYTLLCDLQNICPQIADSLCIVATKGGNIRVDKMLKKALSHNFSKVEKVNLDTIDRAKRIIEKILENQTHVNFNAPVLEEDVDEKPFTLPNKKDFIDCIKKLKGAEVSDFPLVINSKGKHEIAELYTCFYEKVNKYVEEIIYVIRRYSEMKIDEILEAENGMPTSAAARLSRFISAKSTIVDIIKKSENFKSFFVAVKEVGLGINENFSDDITKFCFIEKLKNSYKISNEKSANRELEFFATIKRALIDVASRYSNLISTSEVATEKENREEEEFQTLQKAELKDLNEQIRKLKKDNDSVFVQIVKYLANNSWADITKDAVDCVKSVFS